jgi:nucleoside-diphosphate-sugar epimerase
MSLSDPYPDIDVNIQGTAAVLEACRKRNPVAVMLSSLRVGDRRMPIPC